ncbi:hypothetical protein Tco_0150304 [Tanacetum coccineum]
MTMVVATTVVVVPRAGYEPVHHTLFKDSTSLGKANPDIIGPSYPTSTELSTYSFYVSQEMDSDTLHQTYVPKFNVTNDSALDDPDVCRSVIDHLAPHVLFSQLCSMDYDQLLVEFNVGAARQTCLSSEISAAEATEAARVNELKSLGERNLALEEEKTILDGKVATLASAAAAKDNELASLTAQLHVLSGLRDQVSGYELFKEQSGGRWILSRGVKLVVMKCLQSAKYLAVLGEAIGRAIDKGMQDGLVAGIDHGKAERGLVDVAAYNPSMEANYASAVNALRAVDFPFLAQLES